MARKKRTPQDRQDDIDRSNEAKRLLETPVFASAMEYVEASALRQCREAKSASEAWAGTLRSRAVQEVRSILHAFVAHGESAAKEVDRDQQRIREDREAEAARSAYLTAAQASRVGIDQPEHAATREGTQQ